MKILLGTHNHGKIKEFKQLIGDRQNIRFVTTSDVNLENLVPIENGTTFKENAFIKAKAFYVRKKIAVLADDSGLIVNVLKDKPGVKSSRYAGSNATDEDNIAKLLRDLENVDDRRAYFITVICYYDGIGVNYSEGIIEGYIAEKPKGEKGFGYDPIFVPDGYDKTFAELDQSIKNSISHRSKAMARLKKELLDKL
jgi:XTP/dITP diphosphohydrolase